MDLHNKRIQLRKKFSDTLPVSLQPKLCCCEALARDKIMILLQVVIEKSKLRVGVKGLTAVLDGDLYAAVKPDDSFWNSDGTALEITLQKVTSPLMILHISLLPQCYTHMAGHCGGPSAL